MEKAVLIGFYVILIQSQITLFLSLSVFINIFWGNERRYVKEPTICSSVIDFA